MTETEPSSGGGTIVGGSDGMTDAPLAVGERGRPGSAVAGPLVLPEPFDGTGSWSDWFHFENVSTMNGWDNTQKLRVRLTRHAQKAVLRLPWPVISPYEATRKALN